MTLKCGRRYLMEDKGMLRWAELGKSTGYRDGACFTLEKVRGPDTSLRHRVNSSLNLRNSNEKPHRSSTGHIGP